MGEETYYIDKITDHILKNCLSDEEKAFNQVTLYGKDTDIVSIISESKQYPFSANFRIVIVKEFVLKSHKTKELASQLSNLNVSDVLIVTTEVTENITLASRNLRKVDVCKPVNLDLISLIKSEKVLITLDALKLIEERLG